jgi:hypothetical protein
LAAAGDVAFALVLAAVVVERREPGQGGGFLAAELAEFGHAKQQGECGAHTDAGHALHEVKTTAEVGMPAQFLGDPPQLGKAARFKPPDVRHDHTPQPDLLNVLEAGLMAGEFFLGLLDEGQRIDERFEACVRALCGSSRVAVQAAMRAASIVSFLARRRCILAKTFDLQRLEQHDGQAGGAQMRDHAAFVAAGGFDADAIDAMPSQIPTLAA